MTVSIKMSARTARLPGLPKWAILEREPLLPLGDGHVVLLGDAGASSSALLYGAGRRNIRSKTRPSSRVVSTP
jgi:hypothetical protein